MKKLITLALGALAASMAQPAWAAGADWTVTEASGRVVVRDSAGDHPVTRGTAVHAGATVLTAAGARAVLVRGQDFVTVSAGSRIRVPEATPASKSMVQMVVEWGTGLFKVKHTDKPHFGVKTPYLAAVVKGTTFTVSVGSEGSSVQVLDGAVGVATIDGGADQLVRPGMIATVGANDRFRLNIQGQENRTIDSPMRGKSDAPAAPDAPKTSENTSKRSDDDFAWSEVSNSVITEVVEAKPVDIGTATGGLVSGGGATPVVAMSAVVPIARGASENNGGPDNIGKSNNGNASGAGNGSGKSDIVEVSVGLVGTGNNGDGNGNGNGGGNGNGNNGNGNGNGGSLVDVGVTAGTGNNGDGNGNGNGNGGGNGNGNGNNGNGNGNGGSLVDVGVTAGTGNNGDGNGNGNGNGGGNGNGNNGNGNGNGGSLVDVGVTAGTGNNGNGKGNGGGNGNGNNGNGNGAGGSLVDVGVTAGTGNNGNGNGNGGGNGNGNNGNGNGNGGSLVDVGVTAGTGNNGDGNGNGNGNGGGSGNGNNGNGNGNGGNLVDVGVGVGTGTSNNGGTNNGNGNSGSNQGGSNNGNGMGNSGNLVDVEVGVGGIGGLVKGKGKD